MSSKTSIKIAHISVTSLGKKIWGIFLAVITNSAAFLMEKIILPGFIEKDGSSIIGWS